MQGIFGPERECRRRTRFALEPAELDAEAAKIQERIRDHVLYDVDVSLVPLADGGANIVVFNRRPRDDVRGLVDPSFVAFEVAGFTEQSDWKSRQLMIWLEPYVDGWQIPTSGGRRAVRRGRQASVLGALGVVEITSFRRWLQRTFSRIEAPPPMSLNEGDAPEVTTSQREPARAAPP